MTLNGYGSARILYPEELDELIDSIPYSSHKVLATVLRFTGARCTEAAKSKWKNYNGRILMLPKTDILLDDNKITATGLYELAPKNININLNYNDENNKLLSLFNVNFKGNIKNIQTSLDYNKEKTDQFLADMLEKKMKKVIKDKLDNKFNDIIENLLE